MRIMQFDMYQTIFIAVVMLYIGTVLTRKIPFLSKCCIPAPVTGGLLFAIMACLFYAGGIAEFSFDDTLREVCMVCFFTSVGFQANLKVLKKGGASLLVMVLLVVMLIIGQNVLAIGLARLMGVSDMIGLCTGSIPMTGGHGTAGAFGPVLEDFGTVGATSLCSAAATFGLIAGSLMGGPLGRSLIERKNLLPTAEPPEGDLPVAGSDRAEDALAHYPHAVFTLIIAAGIGTLVSLLFNKLGLIMPVYIGGLIIGAIARNIAEYTSWYPLYTKEIDNFGGICLSLFLGIAMITLKIWQLAELALPLVVLLAGQTLFMFLFARFVVFNIMRRNYDAAVIAAGTCGFGMGATPNAMANMQAICNHYVPSVKAYLLIPVVGSIFVDLINSLAITFIINIL